jgi:hypothetical protein
VSCASIGASSATPWRMTPIAEFDVPKSSPHAIMMVPRRREGDVIYYDAPRVARPFLFA